MIGSRRLWMALPATIALGAGLMCGLVLGTRRGGAIQVEGRTPQPAREHAIASEVSKPPPSKEPGSGILSSPPSEAPRSVEDAAQELWDLILSPRRKSLEARQRLRERGPDMATFFIRKFLELEAGDERKPWALYLAISCGGRGVADFLEELIEKSGDGPSRNQWLSDVAEVLGTGAFTRRPRELPVGVSLMNRTRQLLASVDAENRKLAAAILGFADPSQALPMLITVSRSDRDAYVREAAVRELGRIGDAATLDFLRVHRVALAKEMGDLCVPTRHGDEVVIQDPAAFVRSVEDSIEALESRLGGN